jgi:uncharacterized membrane protein YjjP (DUF1212 family)
MKYLSICINTLLISLSVLFCMLLNRISNNGLFKGISFLGDDQMFTMHFTAESYTYLVFIIIGYYMLVLFFKKIIKSDVYIFLGSLKLSFLFLGLSGFNELYLIPSVIMLLIAFLVNLKRIE